MIAVVRPARAVVPGLACRQYRDCLDAPCSGGFRIDPAELARELGPACVVYRNLDDDREDYRAHSLADPHQLLDRSQPGIGGPVLAWPAAMLVGVDPVESPAPELTPMRRLEKPTEPIASQPFLRADRALVHQFVD